jgi:imidazolonepropionase-like amidohydrolase
MKNTTTLILLMLGFCAGAQPTIIPAKAQVGSVLILNAKAHLGNGSVIENSAIAFENGRLTLVADAGGVDKKAYKRVIDAKGKHVYPGLIATNTPIGLVEIESIRSTVDNAEVGQYNPNIRSIIAYNTDSRITPTIRSNGVMLAQIAPQGGVISGTSSVVELEGWNFEDAVYKMDDALHINFPDPINTTWTENGPMKKGKNEKYSQQLAELETFFKEASAYLQNDKPVAKNLKFEAMRPFIQGGRKIFINAESAKQMMEAILLTKKYKLNPVIVGGTYSWLIADFLKEQNVPVVLTQSQALPDRVDDDIDQPYKNAAVLQNAGVLFCISKDGNWQQRNLAYQAGQSVAFGLDYEAGIASITLNAAKILGIDKTVGSLEVGKDATLILVDGDILDPKSSAVVNAFIRGKEIDLDNKQKQLYRKFQKKYGK